MTNIVDPQIDQKNNVYLAKMPALLVFSTFFIGALAFIVGSLWSAAFKETVNRFQERYEDQLPVQTFWYIAALLVTLLASAVAVIFHRILRETFNNAPRK